MRLLLALVLPLLSSPTDHPIVPGDNEFTRRDYIAAIAAYETDLRSTNDSSEILWRLARVQICLGDTVESDDRERYYRNAESLARASIRIDSMNADAHTWLAVALGSVAMYEGSKTKIHLCNEIKHHLDAAISIRPDNDVAYSILGSFYAALGNVSWIERQLAKVFLGSLPEGGYEEAERAFKKAIELAPNVVRHHYALGLLYRSLDRTNEAREEFRRAASLPVLLARDIHDQELAQSYMSD